MKVLAVLGGADAGVLELAATLGEVVALAVAPQPTALHQASGAAQRVHLWDAALTETVTPTSDGEMVLAAAIAATARRLSTQLVVVAETSRGLLGAAIAEQLALPHLSHVLGAELLPDPAQPLRVSRRCLHGVQQLRGPMMAVLEVFAGPGPGGLPSAPPPAELAVETWSLAEVGLTTVELPRALLRPILPAQHTSFPAKRFRSLEELVEQLRQDGLG